MGGIYTVLHGDTLAAIAKHHGFSDWHTIYDHPQNADFRQLRPNPNLLHPGDQLYVPERVLREVPAATDQKHVFKLRQPTQLLRLALAVVDPVGGDEPGGDTPGPVERKSLVNVPYKLEVEGKIYEGSTDGSGRVEVQIPVDARVGQLTADGHTWFLDIGALNPLAGTRDNGVSGAQGRLKNLGYYDGPISGVVDQPTADALRRYQTDQRLEPTGDLDGDTQSSLANIHGL